jgi:hypothetical protein
VRTDPEAAAGAIWKHIDSSLDVIVKLDEQMRSRQEKRTGTR